MEEREGKQLVESNGGVEGKQHAQRPYGGIAPESAIPQANVEG